jgi:hypothetical protein
MKRHLHDHLATVAWLSVMLAALLALYLVRCIGGG